MVGREAQQAHVACGACGRAWNWHVSDTSGAWWRVAAHVARAREAGTLAGAWRRVAARVMQFLAVLGWVLLRIGRSVFLCLFFGC